MRTFAAIPTAVFVSVLFALTPLAPNAKAGPSSVLASAPSVSPSGTAEQPGTDAATDNSEYREIFQLYTSGDYDSVLKRLSSFERMYPTNRILPSVENLHGMTYLLLKQPALAVPHFRKAADLSRSQPVFAQYILYNLATAQFEAGQLDDAQDTMTDVHPELLDRENQIKVHYLRARLDDKHSAPLDAARECLIASRLYTTEEALNTRGSGNSMADFLDSVLGEIAQAPQIDDLYKNYGDSPFADLLLYRLASLQLKQGDRDLALSNFRSLVSKFPQSPKAPLANQFLMADQNTGPVNKASVGVLLPLSGKFAYFGERSLEAIELAFGTFGNAEPDSKLSLVIEDSGDDTDAAVAALERLANEHHVIAVIGPLLSKGIDQVTQRAQEIGVPLISLARASSAATSGNYVFQAGITLQMQAEQIAKYAVQKLGVTKFAEVYPREKIGVETANYFWDAISALGGTMVGAESYTPDETDFRQVVDKLSGLYYTEARQDELDALAHERELKHIRHRTRRTEQYFSLKPIVDYQAVFIPEETQVTGQILPTFAYRDVENVKFLGTSTWNSDDLISRAQSYAEGALFTDAFFADSTAPESVKFLNAFRTTFSADPTSKEAIAFDAARIIVQVLQSGPSSRSDLKDKLEDVKDFDGVTGKISYSKGLFSRDLKILTIHDRKITAVPDTTVGANGPS